tara:strand:+ start:7296 stop:7727 length:432 start_codon:yes stop_codon:yes gene_type:complete
MQVEEPSSEPDLANIREEWGWVKIGLQEILEENKHLTWRPEDVYAACVSGEAALFVAPEGFVVTAIRVDEFTGKKTLFLWAAWAKERGSRNILRYSPFFENVARELECTSLETWTQVDGLEPYLRSEGWRLDTRIYTRPVHGQ